MPPKPSQRNYATLSEQIIDERVAANIKKRRIALGYTQIELAAYIGMSPQQIYGYESNGVRLTASRLYAIAQALNVPISDFFKDGG